MRRSKFNAGTIYILISRQGTERIRREFTNKQIPLLFDKGSFLMKVGVTERLPLERLREIVSRKYGGSFSWQLATYEGEECTYDFKHGQFEEGQIHKNFKTHRKIRHISPSECSWCFSKDGAQSEEIFFGPLALAARYIRARAHSDPIELKALGEARDVIAQLQAANGELATICRWQKADIESLNRGLTSEAASKQRLFERNGELEQFSQASVATASRWRKIAVAAILTSLALGAAYGRSRGWWLR